MSPLHEELHGRRVADCGKREVGVYGRQLQWSDRNIERAGHMQDESARHQYLELRAGGKEGRNSRSHVDHLLEVIKHQQHRTIMQGVGQLLGNGHVRRVTKSKCLSNRAQREFLIADRGERDSRDTLRERGSQPVCDLKREPGLADAAGTGQGDKAHIGPLQEPCDLVDLLLAANERRKWSAEERALAGRVNRAGRAAWLVGKCIDRSW